MNDGVLKMNDNFFVKNKSIQGDVMLKNKFGRSLVESTKQSMRK